ncbi:aspartate aminotransferase family protein [Saccharibacillus alkalitolerans]|uniref:alanine--glyoxylate transaminase n=1 Tax=Saccharibacillus alkalitolerans TaxID=2705290 RepID=A0ABX0FAH2_9BACL|nr:aspartate aminotransferase family protein [Saccharibacillus alkalitolerans]NGZ77395.1 aspartate aminotransferase family protein [Saccharibacillus alkalitolerans]
MTPEEVVALRKAHFFPCTQHFYRNPPVLVSGSMQHVTDGEGRVYTDFFAGVSVVATGHCNPAIAEATVRQARRLQHTTTIYLTEPSALLAERLAKLLPAYPRVFFCNSGSEANEGALVLARRHTKRRGFISLTESLHGRTSLTTSVTGLSMWRTDPFPDDHVYFIPRPYEFGLDPQEAAERSLSALEDVLNEAGDNIAAMIVEPIQGNGGMIVMPDGYLARAKTLLERYGVLLIADEIQTGFGRTGQLLASRQLGVQPDIVTMAKALGGGIPIGAFAATEEVAASLNVPSASTFGGNPVSAATALAVLDYIEAERLPERAERLGTALKRGLERMRAYYPHLLSEVRGLGLMLGAELYAGDPARGAAVTDRVLEEMKDRGFLIGKNGVSRNVLAFQPPIVIEPGDIEAMLEALDAVLGGIEQERLKEEEAAEGAKTPTPADDVSAGGSGPAGKEPFLSQEAANGGRPE